MSGSARRPGDLRPPGPLPQDWAKILYPQCIAMRFDRHAGAWLLALGLVLIALGARPLEAQEGVYTVSAIAVDTTAETAAKARDAAISQGQFAALQKLFQRLVVQEDLSKLPLLGPQQTADYVQDFSVSNERSAPGRYLADFTFRFKPSAVRNLFQQYGVRFAEVRSKPILVLPVYGAGSAALLWEEPNPWRAAWAGQKLEEGLLPFIVPLGELSDVTAISGRQALAGDVERLAAVAGRYQTSEVLVAHAVVSGDVAQDTASLAVKTGRLGGAGLAWSGTVTYQQQPGENLDGLLARAVQISTGGLSAQWKRRNLLNFGTRRSMIVSVPITNLGAWLETRRRLEGVPSILASEVVFLKRDRGELSLTFIGDEGQLALALRQSDLILTRVGQPGQTVPVVSGSSGAPTLGAQPAQGLRSFGGWQLRLAPGASARPAAGAGAAFTGSAVPQPGASAPTTVPGRQGFVDKLQGGQAAE